MDSKSYSRPTFRLKIPSMNDSVSPKSLVLNDYEILLTWHKQDGHTQVELISLGDPVNKGRIALAPEGLLPNWKLVPFADGQRVLIFSQDDYEDRIRLAVFNVNPNITPFVVSPHLEALLMVEEDDFPNQMVDPAKFQLACITGNEETWEDQISKVTGFPICSVENFSIPQLSLSEPFYLGEEDENEEDGYEVEGSICGTFWAQQRLGKLEAAEYDGAVNCLIWLLPDSVKAERVNIEPDEMDFYPEFDPEDSNDFHIKVVNDWELLLGYSVGSGFLHIETRVDIWRLDLTNVVRPKWSQLAQIRKPVDDDRWQLSSFGSSSEVITIVYQSTMNAKILVEQFALQPPSLMRLAQAAQLSSRQFVRGTDSKIQFRKQRRPRFALRRSFGRRRIGRYRPAQNRNASFHQ